jgi:putative ABC transport system substrate-binding protein
MSVNVFTFSTMHYALCVLSALLFALCQMAEAQQPTKIPRIGILELGSPSASADGHKAFQQGLHELGYVEGKNLILEYRYADGKLDLLPGLAADLVRLKVDAIVTRATAPIKAAKNATKTIPIIFAAAGAPVEDGLVASLAKPGGNVTGLALLSAELDGKKLELLKDAAPKITRVGFLWTVGSARGDRRVRELEAAAKTLGLRIQSLGVTGADDFEKVFEAAKGAGAQALTLVPSPFLFTNRALIIDFAAKNRLPAMYSTSDFVEAGGLMSYGQDLLDNWRRAATYIDKILKGAKPADLPVEQPTKFELVINLKAAKQISLTIPPNVLARADKVDQMKRGSDGVVESWSVGDNPVDSVTPVLQYSNQDNRLSNGWHHALCVPSAMRFAHCLPLDWQQSGD